MDGEPCANEGCDSTKFHIDEGRWFCSRGHDQGHAVVDDNDFDGTQRAKTLTKKEDKVKVRISKGLSALQSSRPIMLKIEQCSEGQRHINSFFKHGNFFCGSSATP